MPEKGDRVEVVKILVLAVLSFVLGFGLVIFFLSPKNGAPDDEDHVSPATEVAAETPTPPSEAAAPAGELSDAPAAGYAPKGDGNPLMAGLTDNSAKSDDGDDAQNADDADAPVEVPPGRTPEGVAIDGSAFYLKCWDKSGQETPGSGCDHLNVLEKRFSTRLYVIDKCKQTHVGADKKGKLSVGMEVDFDANSISFWNGASSTLENAAKVGTCLRSELKGLPIHSVDHKYSRYRLFFTVLFGTSAPASTAKGADAEETADKPQKSTPKGQLMDVIMDRVRVRKSPVDGDIIGKISSGNQVRLLQKKGDWCQVLTPNENEGWMTCEALKK